ncbi:hypothetical protein Vi05172_g2907 [Venturia inaequalis]|nr:hypothetical protein Vi05172_g2907 [Venturia inaequalis]
MAVWCSPRRDVRHAGATSKAWSARPQNIFQNGSVAVDHFSAAGAKVITDFLEDYVLDDESKQLFKDVGHLFWEDSVEIDGDLYWTPGLEKKFLEMYKYDLRRYVLLLQGQNGYQTNWHSSWRLDTGDGGVGVIADFRNLLTILSKTYTDYMTEWGNRVLDMQFSGQWGYNFPIDMLEVIRPLNRPPRQRETSGRLGGSLSGRRRTVRIFYHPACKRSCWPAG